MSGVCRWDAIGACGGISIFGTDEAECHRKVASGELQVLLRL